MLFGTYMLATILFKGLNRVTIPTGSNFVPGVSPMSCLSAEGNLNWFYGAWTTNTN